MQELFDLPEEYNAMLQQGIALTGNDRHFFIHGRFDYLQKNLPVDFRPASILDFGCGTGDASAELAQRFPDSNVYGYDPAKNALAYAAKTHHHPNLTFLTGEELPGRTFNLIFLNCVIHHIQPKLRDETARELASLLAENGQIWVFENNPANPGTQWAMHRNPFDKGVVKIWPGQLKKLLRQAGLKLQGHGFLFYFPQWLAFMRPLEKLLSQVPLGGQYVIMAEKTVKKS
jgi:SAM-dependent methyltransferase